MVLSVCCCVEWSGMDAKMIVFGETALDRLLQWLRASGEPKDMTELLRQYLEILARAVREENE